MPVAATALVWAKPQEGLGGKAPDPRRGHTLTLLPKEYRCTVLLFGGKDAVSGRHCNDLWQLDVGDLTPPRRGTWQWTQLTVKPTIDGLPSRRGGHSATVFRNYFVIFGGLGPEGLLNDVAALDLDNMEWKAPSTSGQPPIRRHQHSSCTFARQLVVFGGFSEYGDCENDIAVLDMDSWNWFVPKLTGEPPSPRMAHSATRFGKDMLVYGGYCVPETDGEKCYLSDVFVLKTDTWTWSTPEMSSAVPSSLERAGHLAEAINDVLLIVGGRGETPQDLCDIWTLDTTNWVWAKPTPVPEIPIAVCPAVSEHGMFLFGAPYSNDCPTDSRHLSAVSRLIIWGGHLQGKTTTSQKAFVLECPNVEYADDPDVFLPEAEAVGNSVIQRPETASQRNWQILDSQITFPRNGILVQWQLWANEAGTVRLQVYRPVAREGRAARMKHPYKLVGENVVTVKETGFCRVHVVDRDQIEVQKGDYIGYRIDADSKLLSGEWPHRLQAGERVDKNGSAVTPSGVVAFEYHTSENPTDIDAKHTGHLCRFCTHEYKGIDEILDFNDDHARNHVGITLYNFRVFSLTAVIVPAPDQTPMPQAEVEEAEKEADLLYIINDPTLAPGPKAVLVDLRDERLLQLSAPGMGMATTGRVRKGGAKKGGKPTNNTSPAKMRGGESPAKGRPGNDSPLRKSGADTQGKGATEKTGGVSKMASAKKLEVGEGPKTPLPKPVLDGRRLPDSERLPKELEMRERELREGTGPYPPPVPHKTQKDGDDDGEIEESG
eukprot:Tamp_05907.p1 GENE.Tamp_05907~~Tamp_05907.p1  ORF type:complete len:772 (-),score=126.19 Tamp_05907:439-2754(-)